MSNHDSKGKARKALRVLRKHYAGSGKPIIKVYYLEERSL